MFDNMKKLFGTATGKENDELHGEESTRIMVATAAILLEVANIDEEFSIDERERILAILKERFNLEDDYIVELVELSEKQRGKTIDLWHFTNIINQAYNTKEKERIIENIWQVIYADGILDTYEDNIVHKLSNLLHIPHSKMIQAKLKYLPEE
jgi:uncharacterized tellurite resistance protein B-like protein